VGLLDSVVEQRIAQAIADGVFDHLPGAGKPLDLEDDRMVPEELRVAYRILKNAGFIPPEVEQRREVADLAVLLRHATDADDRRRAAAKLALLSAKLEVAGRALPRAGHYHDRIVDKVGR